MDDGRKDANVHLKIAKVLLSFIGLWPYDRSLVVYAKRFLYMFTITVEFAFQLLGFLDEGSTRESVVNFATNATFYLLILIKYLAFMLNIENMRVLLDTVESQRSEITDPEERKILYAQDTDTDWWNRLFTITIFLIAGCLTSYNLLTIYFPNEHGPGIKLYYFSDDPKLSGFMLLHMFACALVSCSTALGCEATTFAAILHATGLCRIAKRRCDVAFDASEGLCPVERQRTETRNIIGIMQLQQQATQFIDDVYATCWKGYFSTQGLIVAAACLCMARAYGYVTLWPPSEIRELLVHGALVPLFMFYGYIINKICQILLDTSGDVFWSLSDAPWYKGTVATQKMILFLLQHCKPIVFTFVGGAYQANLEGFSVNVKLVFSYFTMISSV